MNTKIINKFDTFTNYFTKTGRYKNQIYSNLKESGMKEIRQRTVGKDKFVIMGSTIDKKGNRNITVGVDMARGYVTKQTSYDKILTFYNKSVNNSFKAFSDFKGNIIGLISKNLTKINGKTANKEVITKIPKHYNKKVQSDLLQNTKNVDIIYSNGNKYHFKQNAEGERTYSKVIDGVEYFFSNTK